MDTEHYSGAPWDDTTARMPAVDLAARSASTVDADTPTLVMPRVRQGAVPSVEDEATSKLAASPLADVPTLHQVAAPPVAPPKVRGRRLSTLVAVALFVLANLAVLPFQRSLALTGDGYYGLHRVQQCESLGRAPDVLFLGSSRTIYSGDAHLVDDIVQQKFGRTILGCNVGTFSSTITEDYYTLKRMIEDGFTPKIVVEAVWEYNLNVNAVGSIPDQNISAADIGAINTAQILNMADLSDAADLALPLSHYPGVPNPQLDFIASHVVPLYGARAGLLHAICNAVGTTAGPCNTPVNGLDAESAARYKLADDLGWVGITKSSIATLSRKNYINHYQYYSAIASGIANFKIGGHQPEYLARLAQLAQDHGIKLVLVSVPVHPFLLDYLSQPSDWDMIITYLHTFAQQHNVLYYDESKAKGYGDADFVDPQHLDAVGAQKYCTWLAIHVVGPLINAGS